MTTDAEEKRMRVFTPKTFEGICSIAILQEIFKGSGLHIDVQHEAYIDFRDINLFSGYSTNIVLGLPFKGYTLPEEFYFHHDVPFQDFIHAATFGAEIEGKFITSIVDTERDPIVGVCEYIYNNPRLSQYAQKTDKARVMIEAVDAYRRYEWEGNNVTRLLLALYLSSYRELPKILKDRTLNQTVKDFAPFVQGQLVKMKDHIDKKLLQAEQSIAEFNGQQCSVITLYSEEYINELAHALLKKAPTSMPVIVAVGRMTKGNDMMSIRTRDIHAGMVAEAINGGNGKEAVGNVFTDAKYGSLMNAWILQKLSNNIQ
ncbi:hypothetical protein [Bacillus phage SDFMU_Pbc]|uniref:Exopolyphosphatase n=1 Tax=Bacillus phage SDFMU_Pbc TaxID=3076135 RepID=A0AA96KRW5_9CAUD|nr:hypothetical protein [Bacillus phage SDFMU_Pbc]